MNAGQHVGSDADLGIRKDRLPQSRSRDEIDQPEGHPGGSEIHRQSGCPRAGRISRIDRRYDPPPAVSGENAANVKIRTSKQVRELFK